ncbi:hypothetical protein BCR36DRAFT_370547 [Piromyces finnis]|uniref:Uncharacterized protein n=1 Tax=Piromyces finnis TaxID=1754191 RepID=A0A1Y1V9Y5_9FUNG|nr:hypothetical protein BCR36DRAFT_370547 [Piromyces finnis]|eukprot:ORX50042.1 hypothetical protein BCR36DRAFT_370547 [Piromyces finnis]
MGNINELNSMKYIKNGNNNDNDPLTLYDDNNNKLTAFNSNLFSSYKDVGDKCMKIEKCRNLFKPNSNGKQEVENFVVGKDEEKLYFFVSDKEKIHSFIIDNNKNDSEVEYNSLSLEDINNSIKGYECDIELSYDVTSYNTIDIKSDDYSFEDTEGKRIENKLKESILDSNIS